MKGKILIHNIGQGVCCSIILPVYEDERIS